MRKGQPSSNQQLAWGFRPTLRRHNRQRQMKRCDVLSMDATLARARRLAARRRAEAACLPCKAKKAKCNDYRPCARCSNSGNRELCTDRISPVRSNQHRRSLEGASAGMLQTSLASNPLDRRCRRRASLPIASSFEADICLTAATLMEHQCDELSLPTLSKVSGFVPLDYPILKDSRKKFVNFTKIIFLSLSGSNRAGLET